MTNLEYSYFFKTAQELDFNSRAILNYNKSIQNVQNRYNISPRTVSYGSSNPYISSGSGTYNNYLRAITQQESGGRANIVNKSSGALGLYQFMPKTLYGLGYKGTTQEFLNNPALQTQYFHKLTQNNAKQLGIDINKMDMRGAGLLAAAHYGGVGGARKIMSGNRMYGNTNFHGKSPYGYMTDIQKRMQTFLRGTKTIR
jgi:hypothetical protein